jgi:heme-degrading monooxygenase HmoA
MLVIVWEYMARPDRLEEFESLYRPDGPWVELFRKSPGFVSTTLMRDVKDTHRFVIADRWNSEESYEAFKKDFAAEYQSLSERGERTHRAEHLIGRFDFVE